MGEIKWIYEQLSVIKIRNCNLLVVVVVGFGKIVVLVERIIRIIINEEVLVDIDKLLVVIFINVVVVEMRERIVIVIFKELDKNLNFKNF